MSLLAQGELDQQTFGKYQNNGFNNMNENNFLWLITWYYKQCNGDWEHGKGVHIDSIDNPGWSITVNLKDTELENKEFSEVEIDLTDENWLFCFVKNSQFEGRCGPLKLPEILKIFEIGQKPNKMNVPFVWLCSVTSDPFHRVGNFIDIRKRGLDSNYYKDHTFFLLGE